MWTRRQFVARAGLAGAAASVPTTAFAREGSTPLAEQRYVLHLSDTPVLAGMHHAIVSVDVDGERWGMPRPLRLEGMLFPRSMARHPVLPMLYVAACGSRPGDLRSCGVVAAYAICRETGEVRALGAQPLALSALGGTGVAVAPDGRSLLVSASMGMYSVLPLGEDGRIGAVEHALKITGDAPERRYPYLHSVLFHPAGVGYGSDLMLNRLRAISFAGDAPAVTEYRLPSGDAGPTAMVFSPAGDAVFVVARRGPAIVIYPLNRETGEIVGEPQWQLLQGSCATAIAVSEAGDRVYAAAQEVEVANGPHGGSATLVTVFLREQGEVSLRPMQRVRVPEILDARRLVLHEGKLLVVGLGGVVALDVDEAGQLRQARHVVQHGVFSDAMVYSL